MSPVDKISKLRQDAQVLIEYAESLRSDEEMKPAGREVSLVITKLEEARMWGGKALSHFNTGFVPSDLPEKPETHSKLQA